MIYVDEQEPVGGGSFALVAGQCHPAGHSIFSLVVHLIMVILLGWVIRSK